MFVLVPLSTLLVLFHLCFLISITQLHGISQQDFLVLSGCEENNVELYLTGFFQKFQRMVNMKESNLSGVSEEFYILDVASSCFPFIDHELHRTADG